MRSPRALLPMVFVGLLLSGPGCGDTPPSNPPKRTAPEPRPRTPPPRARARPRPAPRPRARVRAAAPRPKVRVHAAARKAPAPRFAPCGTAPTGMACVAGGPFWRGSDQHGRNARPRTRVVVGTFYIDTHEVTTPAFVACVKAGLCKKPRAYLRFRGFHGSRQPAVPVSWANALAICLMQGKRLPTEAEWEKAARTADGRTFPWGNAGPTCRRAAYRGCRPATTRPVGSFAANPYGLYDMAGNGYEWVMDWYTPCWSGCRKACGADCRGPDPRGPCGGALRCKGHRRRVLRGGSWYWSTAHLRTFWRRAEYPKSGNHRLSVRCASRSPRPTPRTAAEVRRLLKRLEHSPLPL